MPSHFIGRAFAVWLFIMAAETVHGILRAALLVPVTGDFRARQIGVFIGAAIIYAITWCTIDWLRRALPPVRRNALAPWLGIGMLWVALTVCFEIALGRLLGLDWPRILEDYRLTQGGLMPLGLAAMGWTPWLVHRTRAASATG